MRTLLNKIELDPSQGLPLMGSTILKLPMDRGVTFAMAKLKDVNADA